MAATALAVTSVGAIRPVAVDAAAPAPTPSAQLALDWIVDELAGNGGSLPGFTPGSSEWGLTADAVLALVAAGRADDAAAAAATDGLVANAAAYTTWAPTMPEVRVAGATAKVVLTLRSMSRPAVADGVDLEAELRALMMTSGAQRGRFSDRVPDPTWDSSNGFGQALGVLALAMTPNGVPAAATDFLVAQQCPSGGFRLTYSGTPGCESDAAADSDATAFSLQALMAAPGNEETDVAIRAGMQWLADRQLADGSFGGSGPTAGPNANSTGVIGQTLRSAGQVEPADRAARWIVEQNQLAVDAVGTPATPDIGAIAYNPAARAAALAGGISTQAADQWRRASVQAVLALGLAPYGPQDVAPLPPITTTSTVPTSTTTSTTQPPTTSSSTTTSAPPTSDTRPSAPTTASDPPTQVLSERSAATTSAGSVAGPMAGPAHSRLAVTGAEPSGPLAAGVLLIATGVLLLVPSRRRSRR
jgi:hypothetical protein